MRQIRQRRALLLIAAIAIGVALLLLLVPHAHSGDNDAWLAILPLFFCGVISPLTILAPEPLLSIGFIPRTPLLAPAFQRPPPSPRA